MQSTPFVNTAPLDILAGTFLMLSILSCILAFCVISAVILTAFNIDSYIDTKGYDLLMIKAGGACSRGYGIRFSGGLQVWCYLDRGPLGKTEIHIYPAS